MSVMYQGKKIAETVDTPVQGIVTQAEFDALPAEQQNKGLYVIDDGESGGGSPMEVYDDQERVIGTWFGKPLYRKAVTVTTPAAGKSSVEVAKLDLDIDSIINLFACVADAYGQTITSQYYWDSSAYLYVFYNKSNSTPAERSNTLRMAVSSIYANRTATIILEYTKTTDQGVTA